MLISQSSGKNSIKMIDFIDSLYKKHKILTKLTQRQSGRLQEQIISLLVNEDQNVDQISLKEIQNSGGIEAFLLQLLGTILDRNPFSNQYQLTRNISAITEQLQAKAVANNKKMKYLEKKSQEIAKLEKQIQNRVKEYIAKIEKDLIRKMQDKEASLKKRINALLETLRTKQKLISDKHKQFANIKSAQTQNQVKQIKEKKLRVIDTKIQNKNLLNMKQTQQINTLKLKCSKLSEQVEKLKRKNRNTELAYKKIKTQSQSMRVELQERIVKQKKEQEFLEKIENNREVHKNIQSLLDELQVSGIQQSENKHQNMKQLSNQMESEQSQEIVNEFKTKKIEFYQDTKKAVPESMEKSFDLNCLKMQEQTFSDLRQKCEDSPEELLKSNKLIQFCQKDLEQQKGQHLIQYYDIILELIQQGTPYYQLALSYFSGGQFPNYFQQSYLNFENNEQIAQATSLILSRLLMQGKSLNFNQNFKKAVVLKKKLMKGNPISIVESNISYLYNKITHK